MTSTGAARHADALKVFAINLEREPLRRQRISEQLESLSFPFEIFSAVDGRNLGEAELARSYDPAGARLKYRDMSCNEIACALSHLGVYQSILSEGLSHALIVEDDAQLGSGLDETLKQLQQAIPPERPVVILLTHVDKYSNWGREALGETGSLVSRYQHWWRAHGYFVTRSAARNLLSSLMPIVSAADHWSRFDEEGIVQLRALVPYCIGLSSLADKSSIEAERSGKHARDLAQRGLADRIWHYAYKRFVYQLAVRPFLRVRRQKQTW